MKKIFFLLLGFLFSIGNAVADVDLKQWMTGLNDNLYISQMSLPGAHDAATKSLSIGKCQDKDIAGLWDAGVRVFDLRPSDSGDDCMIYHGNALTGNTGVTLKAALTTISGRLSTYGSEFAIVLMRKESGGDSWASKVASVINSFPDYVIPFSPSLRLRDVRGKVIILSRDFFADGYTISYWGDKTTRDVKSANGVDFVVQDYYQVENNETKSTAINNLLSEARANVNTRCMFINHTSGYTGSTGTNSAINSNANTCNTLALNTITSNPGPTGIILMDYAGSSSYNGANLVNKIIEQNSSLTATVWAPPAAPGVSLTALAENRDVFVYNIEADAIFSRGFNWLTMAMADRPEGGDNAAGANRQRVQVRKDGNNIKIHWNDREADVFFGQANNTDAGSMWTDLGNAGNRVVFTPASSSNYPNAYTLTNVQHSQKVDVLWKRGGKLTLWNGQGFYDWVFMTDEALNSGELPKFKARKAIWDLYQELIRVNAVDTYASALATANAVYVNANATTDQLRSAFRTLFLAVAESIENPVDVSYIFTHPDISGDKTAQGWSYSDFAFAAGECEKYHAAFTSSQSINDAPNGLYEIIFTGIYRQDDGQNQNAPQLVVTNGSSSWTANFPNMEQLGASWNIGGENYDDWVTSQTGRKPKWMWSASDAQAHEDASAIIESVKVKDHTLGITFKVTGGNQWFNFQRVFITYKGSINSGLYQTLLSKIAEAQDYVTANTSIVPASFLTAISTAISGAGGLSANSEEEDLTQAFDAINNALIAAKAAPSIALLDILQATVNLAKDEGVDATVTTPAEAFISNPTTVDDCNEQLEIVRTARKLNAVDKQPDIFTGADPEDGGQYYLYNIGAQRYLTGGVDYGTHAAVNFAAQVATFTKNGDGWRIHTNIREGSDALNHNGFVDCGGDGDTWYLIEVAPNVYNISQQNSNTGNTLLGYSGAQRGNWWQVDTDNSGADQAINQWKLVTKAERDALMANASEANPVDATYYIRAASFDHYVNSANNSLSDENKVFPTYKWQTWFPEDKGGNNNIGGWEPDFNWEAWNSGNIKFYQELTDLRPGKYRLSVQGYYRHGDRDQAVSEYANPKTDGAILYATNGNGQTAQTYLVPITSEANKVPGIGWESSIGRFPDDRNETAAQYFEAGLYKNVVNEVFVSDDGTLTIGVEKFENNTSGEWIVVDNFRLTYLGVPDITISENDAAAPSMLNVSTKVTLTRTLTGGQWNGFSLPFDLSADQIAASSLNGAEIKQFSAADDNTITLADATEIVAGDPYLIKPTDNVVNPAFTGVTVLAIDEAEHVKGTGDYTFAPHLYNTSLATDGSIAYVSTTDSSIKKLTSGSIKGLRSIFNIPVPAPGQQVKALIIQFEDSTDGILTVDADGNLVDGNIYNVAGQRMNKLQRGVNIVNGKKVLVK